MVLGGMSTGERVFGGQGAYDIFLLLGRCGYGKHHGHERPRHYAEAKRQAFSELLPQGALFAVNTVGRWCVGASGICGEIAQNHLGFGLVG